MSGQRARLVLCAAGLGVLIGGYGCRREPPAAQPVEMVARSPSSEGFEEAGTMTPLGEDASDPGASTASRVAESEVPPVDPSAGEPTGADLAEEAEPETIQRLVDGRVQARYRLGMGYSDVVAFYDDRLGGWTRRELDLAPFGETTTEWESADRVTTVAVSTGPEEGPTRVIIVGPEEG